MITVKGVRTLRGRVEDVAIPSSREEMIQAKPSWLAIPALIDIHVHWRTPGEEYKENWESGAQAALAGGITTVFDMPNNKPAACDLAAIAAKRELIEAQLKRAGIPLHYRLYLGADEQKIEQMSASKGQVIGLKIYMGSTTGGLTMHREKSLRRAFQLAAQENLLVSVHAEDEGILEENRSLYAMEKDPSVHSKIRSREAAIKATNLAISLASEYSTELLIHHVSTKEEIQLIKQAKERGVLVYCEVTPHHLFLNEEAYAEWGTLVQVNPPLREEGDCRALWSAIDEGIVDFIASDHAPHTLEEKQQPYGKAPSGIPGVELTLPLLLNAVHEGKISVEKIVNLMRVNPEMLFSLPRNGDMVLIDMERSEVVSDEKLKTRSGWSPYRGRLLKGWPICTILEGTPYWRDL